MFQVFPIVATNSLLLLFSGLSGKLKSPGRYTGIIDFGEIRGADRRYDLGHFHMRDGELLPFELLPALVCGYRETVSLPLDYEQHIRFTGLLINVRTLARSLQKRPPGCHTKHQLAVLREDVVMLL